MGGGGAGLKGSRRRGLREDLSLGSISRRRQAAKHRTELPRDGEPLRMRRKTRSSPPPLAPAPARPKAHPGDTDQSSAPHVCPRLAVLCVRLRAASSWAVAASSDSKRSPANDSAGGRNEKDRNAVWRH